MKLLDDLIDLLGDDNASLKSALIKAQVLAHRLGDEELGRWVEHELRGYPNDAEVPPYRLLHLTLVGHVTNGYYHYNNQTLPIHHLDPGIRERLTTNRVTDSVSAIEDWAQKDNVAVAIPSEAMGLLSKPLSDTYYVQQAWGRFGIGAGKGVLTEVRSRLLEFCLKISDKIPAGTSEKDVRDKAESVGANDIFRNAVFGDNATIVVGSGSIRDITNSVNKGDVQSLLRELSNVGVKQADLSDLESAIQSDSPSAELMRRQWGPQVSGWVGSMMGKAGTTAWEVTKAAAGNILAAAISAFYGFGS
ncbi:hypothetical protein [Stenotrophomonas tumulicola]|uniref:AbiTii domain-containing protein n=1 Tax=Stenotrophomonas tumulicola TaxID=1685415 RepID=A0A7W3FP21_9GAMM|nr:hypothetical protein [Stenotrophomonas tumulicola]MBA8683058.1 hypothetical protein [Stenotrophomonas tumulicola]